MVVLLVWVVFGEKKATGLWSPAADEYSIVLQESLLYHQWQSLNPAVQDGVMTQGEAGTQDAAGGMGGGGHGDILDRWAGGVNKPGGEFYQ
jgi:hypothetical protein